MSSYAALMETHGAAIAALCRRYGATRLELFGSAADGTFVEGQSDHDFLVELDYDAPGSPLARLLDLNDELEALIGTKVDLVSAQTFRNPYFAAEVGRTRRPVYGA